MVLNEREMQRLAQVFMRSAFSVSFNRQALKHFEEHEALMQGRDRNEYRQVLNETETPDPYRGIKIPDVPIDNCSYSDDLGLQPTNYEHRGSNFVSIHYQDNHDVRSAVDAFYNEKIDLMNSFIGQEITVGKVDQFRNKWMDTWGARINLDFPFTTGFETDHRTQYDEAVIGFNKAGNKLMLKGYTKPEGDRIPLFCRLRQQKPKAA